MFDLSSYCKDCAQLTLGQEKIQEMIMMTENKKKKTFGHPARVAVLAAALVACLGVTAFAASPAGQEMIQEFIITYTFVEKGDAEFGITLHGDAELMTGITLPTMAYAERDGRCILTLDGEELDVTEAMERDGYYTQELEGATLQVNADGVASIIVFNEDGEVDMVYTVELNEEGGSSRFDMVSRWEGEMDENGNIITVDGEPDGAYEVSDAYSITEKDGELVITDPDGNVVDDGRLVIPGSNSGIADNGSLPNEN